METDELPTRLASIDEVRKSTYGSTAKDYFQAKQEGLKVSSAKKVIWLLLSLLMFSTIAPQIFSQRHRDELAQEIRAQEYTANVNEMSIPQIQNEDPRSSTGIEENRSKPYVPTKIKSIDLRSAFDPLPGSELTAILESGGANGTVKARVINNLILNGEITVPSGSVLLGSGASTERRLFISFNKLISADGKVKKIYAQAYDSSDHIRGIKGKKVSDQLFKIGASSALIFLSGLSESLQDQQNSNTLLGQRKSIRDAALGGMAQASSEHGKRMLDELNNENQIEVQKETQIIVIFDSKEETNGK